MSILQYIKKHPWLSAAIVVVLSQLAWLLVAPAGFKSAWSKNPLIAHVIKENALVQEKSKVVAMSYYLPHFNYLADIVSGKQQPEAAKMESYVDGKPYIFHTYYQKAVDYFPSSDAPQALLGYTEYFMGRLESSVKHYEASLQVNPYFFWTYYNLGVIYYRQGQYHLSARMLSAALSMNKDITVQIINQTPFYQQIWRKVDNVPDVVARNLTQGAEDVALVLAACYLKGNGNDHALKLIQSTAKDPNRHPQLWQALTAIALGQKVSWEAVDQQILSQIQARLF